MLNRKESLQKILDKYPQKIDYDLVRKYINLKTYECPEELKAYNGHEDYQNLFYLYCATVCFFDYSRSACGVLRANKEKLNDVTTIIDLGAGNGLTSLFLEEIFGAKIYYVQLDGIQKEFAKDLFYKDRVSHNIEVLPEDRQFIKTKVKVDLVFASDFFEHLVMPETYLNNVIIGCEPKYIVTCNAFTAKHPDHIQQYELFDGEGKTAKVQPSKMSRVFNKSLRDRGYEIYFKGWSGRPTVWMKQESVTETLLELSNEEKIMYPSEEEKFKEI